MIPVIIVFDMLINISFVMIMVDSCQKLATDSLIQVLGIQCHKSGPIMADEVKRKHFQHFVASIPFIHSYFFYFHLQLRLKCEQCRYGTPFHITHTKDKEGSQIRTWLRSVFPSFYSIFFFFFFFFVPFVSLIRFPQLCRTVYIECRQVFGDRIHSSQYMLLLFVFVLTSQIQIIKSW